MKDSAARRTIVAPEPDSPRADFSWAITGLLAVCLLVAVYWGRYAALTTGAAIVVVAAAVWVVKKSRRT